MALCSEDCGCQVLPPEESLGTAGSGCGKSGRSQHSQGSQMQVERYPTDMNSSGLRRRIWLCPPNSKDSLKDPLGLLREPFTVVPHTYTEEPHLRVNGPRVPTSWAAQAMKNTEFEVMYPTPTLPTGLLMTLGGGRESGARIRGEPAPHNFTPKCSLSRHRGQSFSQHLHPEVSEHSNWASWGGWLPGE